MNKIIVEKYNLLRGSQSDEFKATRDKQAATKHSRLK